MTALLATFALSALPNAAATQDEVVAFVHAAVVPMDTERVLEDHTLVVRGGRIAELRPAAEVAVPEGATVVDAAGRYLLPGLVDMHVHTWMESELTAFLASGVTTVRNMFGAPLHLAWRDEIAAGERLGPTIYTAGPIVDGEPPIWPGSRVIETAEDARAAVAEHVEAGYDFVKVYSLVPAEAYAALVEAADEAGLPVMGHVPVSVGVEAALDAGQHTIEHLTGYQTWIEAEDSPVRDEPGLTSRMAAWQHLDEERLRAAAVRSRESGVWNCVTLVVMDKFLPADAIEAEFERPYLRAVHPMTRGQWRSMAPMRAPLAEVAREGRAGRLRMTRELHEAGARLVLGTDSGNPFVVAGVAVHEELGNLVEAGLSPFEALAAATRDAAACLGAEDEFGTLAPGLRADLVLLEENPLEDVARADRRIGVMVRGRWLPDEELQQRLEELTGGRR